MKKFTFLFAIIILGLVTFAQTPQAINYQAVARSADGDPIVNQEISVKISILSGSASGTSVYSELHSVTTNSMGLFSLEIGNPEEVLSGNFEGILWGAANYFLKVEMDENGGSDFVHMGTSQLLSVPYALYSENTANPEDADADPVNEIQSLTKEGQTVSLSEGGGSFVDEVDDADNNPSNELQTLSKVDQTVTLSDDGGSFTDEVDDADANPVNEIQILTQNENEVTLSSGGGAITVADNDNLPANELQQLSKAGSTVTLSQDGGSFTDEVDDADNNPLNEINSSLVLEGSTLEILDAGGTLNADLSSLIDDADANSTNELQDLDNVKNGNTVSVNISEGSGTIIDVTDTDADPVNELQTVAEQDYEVTLSQGGGSFMTGVKTYTQAEIDAMIPYNGLTVHNATTNCINYYYINNWFEACGTCTPQPSQAMAGDDQAFYNETLSATLTANTPEYGTGLWSVINGEGFSFNDASLSDATFTGQPCMAYTLAWTISNSCGESDDQMDITFFATPTAANAGNDTVVTGEVLSVNLNANTPDIGNGLWSVLSGEGGTFDYASNPTTLFTGLPYVEYTLLWAISTVCDTTSDEVNVSFWQCGMPFADTRDSNSYETIEIDDQCWMAENLAYLPNVSPSTQGNNTDPYYYVYNYQGASVTEAKATDNYQNYGALYNWPSSLDACPEGWHLPTHAEWTVLTGYLGGASVAGGKMKSTRTDPDQHPRWNSPNTGATNSSGFSGFPGGYRVHGGSFSNIGSHGYYWSSTEADAASAWYLILNAGGGNYQITAGTKVWGFSVRCLRD